MGVILEILLFISPFALYALWLKTGGRALSPSTAVLSLTAIGLVTAIAVAFWLGQGRSLNRGERYVPARIEDGMIRR
ncbi:DUF6111 family protein [Sabulicella rubraurantiaca]|uniref:DUF6111 family protein n=1 Tax=Sabulicella rubraurantiaca TaxID=2811429 RepID=UPI001A97275A|nr:DUF6111 family protein [Sabulicella rubraurantiaca]